MPYRPYRRIVGPVRWNDPVTTLRYIGPYYAAQMAISNIMTLRDVVVHFSFQAMHAVQTPSPERVLFNAFSAMTRNQNAQTCRQGYLPRPINRMAFNALVDLVDYAIKHPVEFNDQHVLQRFANLNFDLAAVLACNMNEGHGPSNDPQLLCNKVPLMGNVGDEPEITSMRRCPCINNANACNGNGDCVWSENACISRIANFNNRNYALDDAPYDGDWTIDANPVSRPGTRHVTAGLGRPGRMFAIGAPPPVPQPLPPPPPPQPWQNNNNNDSDNDDDDDHNDHDDYGYNDYNPPTPPTPPAVPPLAVPQPVAAGAGAAAEPVHVVVVRRPGRGREVTPQPDARPLPPRRPRRSLRLKEKQKRKSKK